ncbi:MAG: hypothetical protein HZB63_02295 [Deltaproteobacteria bacterium]|nr:hypothetical protein [Deltaproteobacteria bacterium]
MRRIALTIITVGVFLGALAFVSAAEEDCLQTAKLEIAQSTFPPSGSRAAGVVQRVGGTDGNRYLIRAVSGFFQPGDDVSVFTLQGNFVAIGKIYSTYGEESYMDVFNAPEYAIGTGDGVFRNYTNAEARAAVLDKQNVFGNVAAAARMEEERVENQIAAEQRRENADRLKWQDDMTRLRLQLDAQYSSYYYGYRSPYFYP